MVIIIINEDTYMIIGHNDSESDNDSGNTLQPLIAMVTLIMIARGKLQPLSG